MDHLKTHLKEAHKTEHSCSLCPFETSDTVDFFKHTYHHLGLYVGKSKVKLPQWGTWFSELRFDQKINSKNSIVNPVTAQYKNKNTRRNICVDCGKLCYIENHSCYYKKLPAKPCEHCGKIFYRFDSLKNHVEQVHERLYRWKCRHCETKFKHREKIRRHIVIHSRDLKPFMCSVCQSAYRIPSTLATHIKRDHKGKGKMEHVDLDEWSKLFQKLAVKIEPEVIKEKSKNANTKYKRYKNLAKVDEDHHTSSGLGDNSDSDKENS